MEIASALTLPTIDSVSLWAGYRSTFLVTLLFTGLVLKWAVIWPITALNLPRSLLAVTTINILSIQLVLWLPLAVIPGGFITWLFGGKEFSPTHWMSVIVAAALMSTGVELLLLRWMFRVSSRLRVVVFLSLANLICVSVAGYAAVAAYYSNPPLVL